MAESVSGIKPVNPSYPLKPVLPVRKDRETDRRRKPPHQQPDSRHDDEPDGDGKLSIDEHV